MKFVYLQNVCKINGEPCPGENNLCQVGFTDKRYRCVCRDGYKHREHSSDQCEGKIQGQLVTHAIETTSSDYEFIVLSREINLVTSVLQGIKNSKA